MPTWSRSSTSRSSANDGRIYAGASNNWGTTTKVDQVPIYQLPVQQDADSLGFYLRTDSLSTDIEPYFNETTRRSTTSST